MEKQTEKVNLSGYQPGEVIVIREYKRSVREVMDKLDLNRHCSDQLLNVLHKIPEAMFSFAVDASSGYIHAFRVGKRNDTADARCLFEFVLRDKSEWQETYYPMVRHCTPKLLRVKSTNRTFAEGKLDWLLEPIGCKVEVAKTDEQEPDILDVLASNVSNHEVAPPQRPKAIFDARVTRRSISSGALERLTLQMWTVVALHNHIAGQDGQTPDQKMAEFALEPAPSPAFVRVLCGKHVEREITPEGALTVYGIPYSPSPAVARAMGAGPKKRVVAVDDFDLFSVSVLGEDDCWFTWDNLISLYPGYHRNTWRAEVRDQVAAGTLKLSDYDLAEDFDFRDLQVFDKAVSTQTGEGVRDDRVEDDRLRPVLT